MTGYPKGTGDGHDVDLQANRYMKAREPVPLHINDWIWSACKAEMATLG